MRRRRTRREEDLPVLQQTGIFSVKAERDETESNEAQLMEIEAQMFEAERARARQSWKDNALKAEIAEVEERDRRDDIEGEENVQFMR